MTKKKVFIRIRSAGRVHKTSSVAPAETGRATWKDIHMNLTESPVLMLEVFRYHTIWWDTLLAGIEIPFDECGDGQALERRMNIHHNSLRQQGAHLAITMQANITAGENDFEAGVRDRRARNDKVEKLVEPTNTILEVLGKLSEANEIARAAFMVVSGIWQVVKAQHEKDKAVVALYDVMIETYEIAVDKKALNHEGDFSELFEAIVRQSQECFVFLSKYMFQGRLRQVVEFWDGTSKISELNAAFERLQERFFKTQVELTTVVVLDIRRTVESLRIFYDPNHIACWAPAELRLQRYSNGLSMGNSPFYGSLALLAAARAPWSAPFITGFNSRLAAFIRFDRSEYADAGEFVKALAFLLANFDERFGKPIAEVVERSLQIAETTDLSTQVQKLLINPLRSLSEEIAREGRIVILVDGIDECSRQDQAETRFREQLLELFEKDAFRLLPFLRFVLASRPEEDIVRSLQHCGHINRFPLDHTSLETTDDIHYFLNKSFERSCFNNLTNAQKYTAVERLAERASGLFVWAATVVTFIGENVEQRLKTFVQREPPKNALQALTALYKIALESLVREGDEDIKQNICIALGLIMAASPSKITDDRCTIHVLHDLLKYVDPDKAPGILSAFHKLRSLVTEERGSYQLLHKSFDDFLTSKGRARHWYIDTKKYYVMFCEAMITCTMDYLDKADEELPEALSSNQYRHAMRGPIYGVERDLSLYPSLQQTLIRFLLGYVVGDSIFQRRIGQGCHDQAEKLQHDSKFMQKAWLDASRLQGFRFLPKEPKVIIQDIKTVKDFFKAMLSDTARAGKVTKTNPEDPLSLEWEVNNIYMSIFVQMAGGSNIYENIIKVLDTNPIPPVVSLGPEIEMPIKIVSRGEIMVNTGFIEEGKEVSAKEFIEWFPIAEPEDLDFDSDW